MKRSRFMSGKLPRPIGIWCVECGTRCVSEEVVLCDKCRTAIEDILRPTSIIETTQATSGTFTLGQPELVGRMQRVDLPWRGDRPSDYAPVSNQDIEARVQRALDDSF